MSCTKKVHEKTTPAFPSSLELFTVPPTNVAFVSAGYKNVLPLNPVSGDPYTFRVYSDNSWLDLSKTYIQTEFVIEKKNKDDAWVRIEATDNNVAPVQLIGLTLYSQLRVSFNGTDIYDSGTLYPYRAYFGTELSCSDSVKATELGVAGYAIDNAFNDATDKGFIQRKRMLKDGKCTVLARLDFDFANQPLLLLNDVDVVFTLYRNNDKFCLQSIGGVADLRIRIESIKLLVNAVELQPSLNVTFFKKLEDTPAAYALRKTELRAFMINSGRMEFTQNLFTSIVPRRVVFALVAQNAFYGDVGQNPFNFKGYGLREFEITAGGRRFPYEKYKMNFDQGDAARPYLDLFHALGQHFNSANCGITFSKFKEGWTIFVVDLTASQDETCGFELVQNGSTDIKLEFATAVPEGGLELVVMAEYDQVMSIDNHRRIKFEN
uniref:BACON domain-containing protein n=1 Tax=Panagrellus redivivus TaxID=6233 RepID=A0A7E4ZQB0_PANRE